MKRAVLNLGSEQGLEFEDAGVLLALDVPQCYVFSFGMFS